jgi:CheY-like chemotaxis protein
VCADAEAVQVFSRIFQELDIAVECCADRSLAQARIGEVSFDVLLLDCCGARAELRLISGARSSPTNRTALIIAIVNNPAQSAQAFAAGANFVLYKPVLQEHISQSRRATGTRIGQERRTRPRFKVDLPADISFAAKESVSVMLMDLSENGLAFKAPFALPANCKVYFQFFLPGATAGIRLSGEVMWQSSGRAGVRFVSVPQASQRALNKWLQDQSPVAQFTTPQEPAAPAPENQSLTVRLSARLGLLLAAGNSRRNLPRYPCRLGAEVYRAASKVPQRCNLTDLNTDGCYVETSEPFPVETPLRILVRAQGVRLSLEGKVRIVHPGFGMGVQFTSQPAAQSESLQRLIDYVQAPPK